MKVRIMLKRIVQPPIETTAGIDYHSIEIEVDEITVNRVMMFDGEVN